MGIHGKHSVCSRKHGEYRENTVKNKMKTQEIQGKHREYMENTGNTGKTQVIHEGKTLGIQGKTLGKHWENRKKHTEHRENTGNTGET